MNLQLLLKDDSPSCQQTNKIWSDVCDEYQLELQVVFLNSPEGKALSERLRVSTFPALIADGTTIAVGKPEPTTARPIIVSLIDKQKS